AAVLEKAAEDAREVADVAGHQEVVAHEAFDGGGARAVRVSEARRDLALEVEGEAVVGAAREIVEIAAHGGEEIVRLDEAAGGIVVDNAGGCELADIGDAVEVLRDPEEGVEIAQAALVFLDVRFEAVARIAQLLVAFVALGEFRL